MGKKTLILLASGAGAVAVAGVSLFVEQIAIDMKASNDAAEKAAARLDIRCNRGDVSREPVPYKFYALMNVVTENVQVQVDGDLVKDPKRPGAVAKMIVADTAVPNGLRYFYYPTRCNSIDPA